MIKTASFVLSGWSFYFRWPTSPRHQFFSSGILLGPLLQAAVFWVFSELYFLIWQNQQIGSLLGLFSLSVLTGFFHEDGFADSFDSLGVPAMGDLDAARTKILSAMRDSRLGTFGVSAICGLWMARGIGVFVFGMAPQVFVATILLSRVCGLAAGRLFVGSGGKNASTKASHQLCEIGWTWILLLFLIVGVLAYALLRFNGFSIGASAAVGVSVLFVSFLGMWGWSRRSGEVNGDIIGASICLGEIAAIFTLGRAIIGH